MDSSFSSRSRGSEPRATRSLPSPSASLGRHPTRALSHFRISLSLPLFLPSLVDPWRFVLFGPVYLMSFSPSQSPGTRSPHPFPGENVLLPFFVFVACSLSPPNSSLAAEDRSPYLPTSSIRRFYASHPWVPATALRSIHSPVSPDDASSTPRERGRERVSSGVGKSVAPHCIAQRT